MSQNEQMDQTTDQAMQTAANAGKKIANSKPANAAKKGAKKLGKKAGKALLKAGIKAAKLLIKLIIKVVLVAWPIILVFVGIILFIVLVDHFSIENRGASQEFDFSEHAMNKYLESTNDYGDPNLMTLSEENAFLQIFYAEEAAKSYWKYYEIKDEVHMDYGGSRELFHKEVKDKYDREQYFLLTAMNLYALEEYLNENTAFTPQTFVQHVPFEVNDEGRLDALPLLNDDGEISIKSQAFEVHGTNDEGMTTYRKKYDEDGEPVYTEGIWDYGLAPVYHYEDYEEEYEIRSSITGAQVWDIKTQKFREMSASELSQFVSDGKPDIYNEYKGEYNRASGVKRKDQGSGNIKLVQEKESQTVWMIRDAVTPMGAIKNEISQNWEQTDRVHKEIHTISMNVPIRKTRQVQAVNENGEKIWKNTREQARYVKDYNSLNGTGQTTIDRGHSGGKSIYPWGYEPNGFPDLPDSSSDSVDAPAGWKVEFREVQAGGTTTKNNGDDNKIMTEETYYELEPREHQVETTGVEWEFIPRYVGEPDTSDLSGLDYYHHYFENYENYVTEESFPTASLDDYDINLSNVQEDDDFEEIIVQTPMDVLKYIKMDEARNQIRLGDNGRTLVGKYNTPHTLEERLEGKSRFGHKEHPVMSEVRDLQVEALLKSRRSGKTLDLTDVNFAESVDSDAVQNASEYYDLFEKYGEIYGIDPMLLLAIAAHESNGRHYANHNEYQSYGVRRSYDYEGKNYADYSAIGLMQVRPLHGGNANTPRPVRAFNHETQEFETFKATSKELHDPDTNVKFATMLLASEIRYAGDDVLVGVGSYHYGGKFAQHLRDNGYQGWSMEAEEAYLSTGRAGTLGFVPNVLQYYLPTDESPTPWAMNEDGIKTGQVDGDIEFATGESVDLSVVNSITNRKKTINKHEYTLSNFFSDVGRLPLAVFARTGTFLFDVAIGIGKFFGITDGLDHKDYYRLKGQLTGSQAEELIYMMMSYEEGLYMNEYESMTLEEFEERFLELFLADVRKEQNAGMGVNPKDFFPDGFISPVENVVVTAEYNHDYSSDGDRLNGIQLLVPGGTDIMAVANGTVIESKKNVIKIDHGNDVTTTYLNVGDRLVKKNDEVKKGDVIARGSAKFKKSNHFLEDSIGFILENPLPTNPTWIVDPSLLAGEGSLGIDPNAGTFQHPYYGKEYAYTSDYGIRIHPRTKVRKLHAGVDMAGRGKYHKNGTMLGSVADGVVSQSGYDPKGWGYYVVIHHDHIKPDGKNMWSLYAHMAAPTHLSVGTRVQAGDGVGPEGTTGSSTGEHLHLEFIHGFGDSATGVRRQNVNQNTTDPRPLLPD